MSRALPISAKSCDEERLEHKIFGVTSIHQDFKRNRDVVRCAFCGVARQPGEAVRVWCKKHKHVLWVGCNPPREMTARELIDEARAPHFMCDGTPTGLTDRERQEALAPTFTRSPTDCRSA